MKYKLYLILVLMFILFSGIVSGGCYKSEKAIKEEVEEKTGLIVEKGSIYTYKDKKGNLIIVEVTKKKPPNGFSKIFPVLKNGILLNGYKRTFKGSDSYSVQWKTNESFDSVKNWYLNELKSLGWNKTMEKEIAYKTKKGILINFDKDKYEAKITILSENESESILVYVYLN